MGVISEKLKDTTLKEFVVWFVRLVLPSILYVLHAEVVLLVVIKAFQAQPISPAGAIANIVLLAILSIFYASAHRWLRTDEMRAEAKRREDLERQLQDRSLEPDRPSSSPQVDHPSEQQQQVQERPALYQGPSMHSSARVSRESRQSQIHSYHAASSMFRPEHSTHTLSSVYSGQHSLGAEPVSPLKNFQGQPDEGAAADTTASDEQTTRNDQTITDEHMTADDERTTTITLAAGDDDHARSASTSPTSTRKSCPCFSEPEGSNSSQESLVSEDGSERPGELSKIVNDEDPILMSLPFARLDADEA